MANQMQLLMTSAIFLGGLKDEAGVCVRENGPGVITTAKQLAREVEVVMHNTTCSPKGITVDSLQELGSPYEEESYKMIKSMQLEAQKTQGQVPGQKK